MATALRMENWMEQMSNILCNAPLHQVAIPGTHDTFTYEITKNSEFSPDFTPPPALQKAMKVANRPVKRIFSKWSKCQQVDITTQLNGGVRYLDIRVCKFNDQYYTCHGMIGTLLDKALQEVKQWVMSHPKEIIIMDFNHFYGMDAMADILLQNKIVSYMEPHLVPQAHGPTVRVGDIWQQNRSVIWLYDSVCINEKHAPYIWTKFQIQSKWHNKQRADELLVALQQEVESMRQLPQSRLWVFQGICTPNDKTCISGVTSYLRPFSRTSRSIQDVARKVGVQLFPKLKGTWHSEMLNIVIIDMFDPNHEFASVMVNFNTTRPWAIQNPTFTPASSPQEAPKP